MIGANVFKTSAQSYYDQLSEYFTMFDQLDITTNFLLNKGFLDPNGLENSKLIINSGSFDYTIITPLYWQFLYKKMRLSDMRTPPLDSLNTFWNTSMIDGGKNIHIPIGIININGEHLYPDSIEHYIDLSTGKITPNAPMETIKIFAISNLQESVYSNNIAFQLNPHLYFSNTEEEVLGLAIDFDDGKGYRNFSFSRIDIPVSYAVIGHKNIRYKL